MATTEERLARLEAQVELLGKALAGSRPPARDANPLPPSNPDPRWLKEARFANDCAVDRCKTRIEKGERCYFVPKTATEKSKVYCAPCATAMGF